MNQAKNKTKQVKNKTKQLEFDFCCKTDIGKKRKKNEDSVGYYVPKNKEMLKALGLLFIVADGVGGNTNGNVASKIAVSTIIRSYYSTLPKASIQEHLNETIKEANRKILEESIRLNTPSMATTVVVAVVFSEFVLFANVGDSRAYVSGPKRENGIEQVTVDHTVIEEQLEKGLISEREARYAKNKNVITNALGNTKSVKIDFFKVPLLENDRILITTDGLTHVVKDKRIQQILSSSDITNVAKDLINLANLQGGPDNITLCVIKKKAQKTKRKITLNYKNLFICSLIALALVVAGVSFKASISNYLKELFHPQLIATVQPSAFAVEGTVETAETNEID
ncbi:MAG: Stp1/IreP family PP2C-type Ser/Thr phosphatase, partial [Caldisericia bacterium]|nr:Stp1/IreP family PP2C-type Ser/Thr phosphatase [Caldisericia bacterium]